MKYLKEFNENKSNKEFDLDFAMAKIKEKYSKDDVIQMFDDEWPNWIDEGWEEDYEEQYDWYMDHNNKEAEDVVVDEIITWYKSEYNLPTEHIHELFSKIMEYYDL